MSASAWLHARRDGVPRALSEKLEEQVDGNADADVAAVMTRAAGEQLARVLSGSAMSRGQALDLLAADAFATYALEAAASEPATLAEHADAAMTLFAKQVERLNA